MDVTAALSLMGHAAVRGAGLAAGQRLRDLADRIALQRALVCTAGDRIGEASGTSWDSEAADLFKDGMRQAAARSRAVEEALFRAETHLRAAADEVAQALSAAAMELARIEGRMAQRVIEGARHAAARVHAGADVLAGVLGSPVLQGLKRDYDRVVEGSMVTGVLGALTASGGVR